MMNRYFDNWERLVTATRRREELRELALAHSRDPSLASDFCFTSPLHDHFWDPEANRSNITSASSSSSIPSHSKEKNLPSPTPRPEGDVMPISFYELTHATRYFRHGNILGEGRFGPVFKGWINTHALIAAKPGSGMAVAVKKYNGMPGFKKWLKEVNYLSQLHHPNLVKLLAYCDKGDNLLLVYEFMQERSLFNLLFRGDRRRLSWNTRIKVAIGAARGLSFLHNAENNVIHKNFRSSNILLDKEFNAKLSDFGYAEVVRIPYEAPTGIICYGSSRYIGYASPDYRASGYWSKECDVYAFGVVLLELLCGCKAFHRNRTLVDWAKPYFSDKKRVYKVMDPLLDVKFPHKGVLVFATLALRCVTKDPYSRPHMAEVLAELERLKGENSPCDPSDTLDNEVGANEDAAGTPK